MTRDEVIRLAQEAGGGLESDYANISALERFAALVAAHTREECAKVCESLGAEYDDEYAEGVCNDCAAAIRAISPQPR